MEPEFVTFEQLDREAREAVLRDEARVRNGEITKEELHRENSIFPIGTTARIHDLAGYLARNYGSR